MTKPTKAQQVKRFFADLGPGLITGAADDDPSGISTYSVAGAAFGYLPLWTALLSFPLMATVQLMCARLGLVTGRGLAGGVRLRYPRWVLWGACSLLIVANVFNIGADLGGMADATEMITGIDSIVWTPVYTGLIIALLFFSSSYRRIASIFKWLTLVLFAYVGAAFLAQPDWQAVVVATVRQREGATKHELRVARTDILTGMLFSNMVMYFFILTTAATLHAHGRTDITSARDAAEALRPLAGDGAYLLFTLGIIGTGFLGVPVLAGSAAYAVAEALNWRGSLEDPPLSSRRFYAVVAVAMLLGLALQSLGLNAVRMLFYSAVLNGVLAPPLIVLVILLTRRSDIMGQRVSSRPLCGLGKATALIMGLASLGMAFTA